MRIVLEPHVALYLETVGAQTRGLEFSGLGFIKIDGEDLVVYDVVLMDIGSEGFTEFDTAQIAALMQREDRQQMRLWFHCHPIGTGTPGPENWSGTDENTAVNTPLGGVPELVGWSAAIVRTPRGWVGRVDNHKTRQTLHVEVAGQVDQAGFDSISRLVARKVSREATARFGKIGSRALPFEDTALTLPRSLAELDEIDLGPIDRDNYAGDEDYLADLAAYEGADREDLEIDANGDVWLGTDKVGAGCAPFGREESPAQKLLKLSKAKFYQPSIWSRILTRKPDEHR